MEIHLRILDQQVYIHTDDSALAAWLHRLYERFRTASQPPTLEILAQTRQDSAIHAQTNTAVRLPLHGLPVEQQANIVLKTIYAHVESHLLFHAAAVTVPAAHEDAANEDGSGVLLAGHSGRGKSTLTLELVRRGWGFLSDEVAPLAQADGVVEPFPRAVHLRPQSLPLLGLSPDAASDPVADEWVDIDQFFPGRLSGPVSARVLFVLEDEAPSSPALLLSLDRGHVQLTAALHDINGVDAVNAVEDGRRLRLTGDDVGSPRVYYQIEHLCAEHACRILDLSLDRRAPALFAETPAATPLAPADAVIALFPSLLSGRRSRLWYGPWQGSPLALFRTLAVRLSQMRSYRLRVGPLTETADLIERTVGESP